MNVYVGIDLGSTTTKAVVIDDKEKVLGRGITNSRSNYLAACAVAKTEALIDTRLSQLRVAMDGSSAHLLALLERHFRLEQYLDQLARLERTIFGVVGSLPGDAAARRIVLGKLFEGMREEAPALIVSGQRKSDFFRDIAGSSYHTIGERLADPRTVPLDHLMGFFDRCIITVENEIPEMGFAAYARPALQRTLAASTMSESEKTRVATALAEIIDRDIVEVASVGTGYGRQRLPFPKEQIRSEILCHGLGAHAMFPESATVLDIGGQDTKAIQLDNQGVVTSFQMNDRCAAGCGRYLGYIADEMNIGLHELGPLALDAHKTVKINSTCTVFAGAELRERLSLGQRREDILSGLHRAIMLRAMSLLARSGGIRDEFTFTGGVAKNPAAVKALKGLVEENYGARTLNISPESIYTGALGAALYALRDVDKLGGRTDAHSSRN